MKRLLLGLCFWIGTTQDLNPEEFLSSVHIVGDQYESMRVMLHVLEELSIEDRTIIYVYLESLEDKAMECDEETCYECAAQKVVK